MSQIFYLLLTDKYCHDLIKTTKMPKKLAFLNDAPFIFLAIYHYEQRLYITLSCTVVDMRFIFFLAYTYTVLLIHLNNTSL